MILTEFFVGSLDFMKGRVVFVFVFELWHINSLKSFKI